jgi:hypothetical protein
MVAQVFADARQRVANLQPQSPQALRLADAGQFKQLRRIERTSAHDHLARSAGLMHGATGAVADTDATLALEQNTLGQRARLDAEVRAPADRIEIAVRRAHAATVGDRRLAHGYAVLPGTIVVGVVRDPDLARCLDQRSPEGITRLGVADA